jgi:hypothetical protein
MPAKEKVPSRFYENRLMFIAWIMLILLMGLAFGFYQFQKINDANKLKNEQAQQAKAVVNDDDIVRAVSKLMLLPSEKPSVAVITDVANIKSEQPFFANAQDGDRILVYSDRAVIYSVKNNLVVNTGPISLIKTESDETMVWKLEIRNGSRVKGAAAKLSEQYKTDPGFELVDVTNASRNDYQGNLLINFTAKDVAELATSFSASSTSALPEGEASSSADLLLIIGNN